MNLDWRTITAATDAKHWRNGTELACAVIPHTRHRFVIYSVRTHIWIDDPQHIDGGYYASDATYHVRDADTVTDSDVRAGTRPHIIARFKTLDEAERWFNDAFTMTPTI